MTELCEVISRASASEPHDDGVRGRSPQER